MAEYRLTYNFYQTLRRLPNREQCRVFSVMETYLDDPFHESLERRRVNRNDAHFWHIRASESVHALVSHFGETATFERVLGPQLRNDTATSSGASHADSRRSSGLSAEAFRRLLDLPVQGWEWLIFLDDDQLRAVESSFAGVSRVSGPAGTGKTVVALHRAARLATASKSALLPVDQRPVLFTTFSRSLPLVLRNLYQQLPNAVANGVEFINIDQLANEIVREVDGSPKIAAGNGIYVLERVRNRMFPFDRKSSGLTVTTPYLHDEIEYVIKGRMIERRKIETLADYLSLSRKGRGRGLSSSVRERVWQLYEAYQRELERAGLMTFADVARRAGDIQSASEEPQFSSAIVDEAQDLTEVKLRLVRALVNGAVPRSGRRDELLLVGDSSQQIYPGGFRLEEVGSSIRGRGIVLRRNFRNTKQIMQAAWACVGDLEVAAGEQGEVVRRGDVNTEVTRSGPVPRLVMACSLTDQASYTAQQIKRYCGASAVNVLNAGVLTYTNRAAQEVCEHLRSEGIACTRICRDGPVADNGVRVATFDRAKGLEFSVVFVLGVSAEGWLPTRSPDESLPTDDERQEQEALAASRLYVAMTRARDVLHVCFDGQPSAFLRGALDHFELVKTDAVIRHNRNLPPRTLPPTAPPDNR